MVCIMKMKKISIGIISAILVLLIILYHNNYSIILSSHGISTDLTDIIDFGVDPNGNEYRAIETFRADGSFSLAYCVKGDVGIWTVPFLADSNTQKTDLVQIGWLGFTTANRFDISDSPLVIFEDHQVYAGNNALKLITFSREELPDSVSVTIRQSGSAFVLHFVSYGEADTLTEMRIPDLLRTRGFIP